jgi:hypothetical protein
MGGPAFAQLLGHGVAALNGAHREAALDGVASDGHPRIEDVKRPSCNMRIGGQVGLEYRVCASADLLVGEKYANKPVAASTTNQLTKREAVRAPSRGGGFRALSLASVGATITCMVDPREETHSRSIPAIAPLPPRPPGPQTT